MGKRESRAVRQTTHDAHAHHPNEGFDMLSSAMVDVTMHGSIIGNVIQNTDYGDDGPEIKRLYHEYTIAFVKMSMALSKVYDPDGPMVEIQQVMLDQLIATGPMP